jgi:prepilin signal peptidase PulO-like enzyme (type II secretory pathway)
MYRREKQISLIIPSACDYCGTKLSWYNLIPVVGVFITKGTCKSCGNKIPLSYTGAEVISAAVCAAAAVSGYPLWFTIPYMLLLVFIISEDFYDMHISILPLILLFLLTGIYIYLSESSLTAYAASAGISFIFMGLLYFFSGRKLGLGDVLLSGILGLMIHPLTLPFAYALASLSGLLWAAVLFFSHKVKKNSFMKTPVPFGPFLILGFQFSENLYVLLNR